MVVPHIITQIFDQPLGDLEASLSKTWCTLGIINFYILLGVTVPVPDLFCDILFAYSIEG